MFVLPDSQRSYLGQIRGRLSEDRPSDVIQTSFNYSALRQGKPLTGVKDLGLPTLIYVIVHYSQRLILAKDLNFRMQDRVAFDS